MRLDYLTDVEPSFNPMVRLYDFDPTQVELIRSHVFALANGSVEEVLVHELRFITAIDNCQLSFKTGAKDLGIRELGGNATLECTLTPETWSKVAGYHGMVLGIS
jgi:hypothetical protein